MDQSNVSTADSAAAVIQTLYGPIEAELAEAENVLRGQLRSRHAYVDELVRYGCLLGGKRLRPALLLLAAKACGAVNGQHLVLAAVVEMIHTATLVHDDVLDEADTRRHLATVNSRWDVEASVLLGDYLFTHAFYLASTLDTPLACRLIGEATNIVCEGELRQKGSRGNYDLTEQEYFEIIEAKTAELCACSCRLGAHFAGAEAGVVKRLAGFGRDLGVAFQIADDVLDVAGDQQVTGKPLGGDLDKEKPTLPLLRVLNSLDEASRAGLVEQLQAERAERRAVLAPYLAQFEAIEYARKTAQHFADRARRRLAPLPASEAKEALDVLTRFVVERSL